MVVEFGQRRTDPLQPVLRRPCVHRPLAHSLALSIQPRLGRLRRRRQGRRSERQQQQTSRGVESRLAGSRIRAGSLGIGPPRRDRWRPRPRRARSRPCRHWRASGYGAPDRPRSTGRTRRRSVRSAARCVSRRCRPAGNRSAIGIESGTGLDLAEACRIRSTKSGPGVRRRRRDRHDPRLASAIRRRRRDQVGRRRAGDDMTGCRGLGRGNGLDRLRARWSASAAARTTTPMQPPKPPSPSASADAGARAVGTAIFGVHASAHVRGHHPQWMTLHAVRSQLQAVPLRRSSGSCSRRRIRKRASSSGNSPSM